MGEAARRKKQQAAEFQELDQRLRADGVDTSHVGFYDQQAFVDQEKCIQDYLKLPVRWLARRPVSESYLQRAKRTIPAIAERVAQVYTESGMLASCLNGSAMLSRVLERAGIWNHIIHGCFVLQVPSAGIWRGFQTVDAQDFPGAVCGHAWVFAPPYHVVDVNIATQRWQAEERPFVPALVATPFTARIRPELADVVAARLRPRFAGNALWGKRSLVYEAEPELREMEEYVAPMDFRVGAALLRYVPVASRLPDSDLESTNSGAGCAGPTGAELWAKCADLVARLTED